MCDSSFIQVAILDGWRLTIKICHRVGSLAPCRLVESESTAWVLGDEFQFASGRLRRRVEGTCGNGVQTQIDDIEIHGDIPDAVLSTVDGRIFPRGLVNKNILRMHSLFDQEPILVATLRCAGYIHSHQSGPFQASSF